MKLRSFAGKSAVRPVQLNKGQMHRVSISDSKEARKDPKLLVLLLAFNPLLSLVNRCLVRLRLSTSSYKMKISN